MTMPLLLQKWNRQPIFCLADGLVLMQVKFFLLSTVLTLTNTLIIEGDTSDSAGTCYLMGLFR